MAFGEQRLEDREGDFRARVGARIRQRRLEAGLSQPQLARQLPGIVESGTVSRWERGRQHLSIRNVVALADIFDVAEEEILCGPD